MSEALKYRYAKDLNSVMIISNKEMIFTEEEELKEQPFGGPEST